MPQGIYLSAQYTKSAHNKKEQRGVTNGNAKKGKKCGHPENKTPDDNCNSLEPNTTHIYFETEGSVLMSKSLIMQLGQKMLSLWATIGKHSLAPMIWSEADSLAVRFVNSAILNDPRFHYLHLCDDNWKLKHWITKNYPSWVRNHLNLVLEGVLKVKKEALDIENLLKIMPEPSDSKNPLKSASDSLNVISHEESKVNTTDLNIMNPLWYVHSFLLQHLN